MPAAREFPNNPMECWTSLCTLQLLYNPSISEGTERQLFPITQQPSPPGDGRRANSGLQSYRRPRAVAKHHDVAEPMCRKFPHHALEHRQRRQLPADLHRGTFADAFHDHHARSTAPTSRARAEQAHDATHHAAFSAGHAADAAAHACHASCTDHACSSPDDARHEPPSRSFRLGGSMISLPGYSEITDLVASCAGLPHDWGPRRASQKTQIIYLSKVFC